MSGEGAQAGFMGIVAPFFVGAPWVPKFRGTGSDIKFGEWEAQIEVMLKAQAWSVSQQCNFFWWEP